MWLWSKGMELEIGTRQLEYGYGANGEQVERRTWHWECGYGTLGRGREEYREGGMLLWGKDRGA